MKRANKLNKVARVLGKNLRMVILNDAEKIGGKKFRKVLEKQICNPIKVV